MSAKKIDRRVTAANRELAKLKRESRERQFLAIWKRFCGATPEMQHRFEKSRRWRFDFAWPAARVAVEIEGGTFGPGKSRHTSGEGHRKDCEKYNRAAALGWCVLRYTSKDLDRRPVDVINEIKAALAARSKS